MQHLPSHKGATGNEPPKSGVPGEWIPRKPGEEDPNDPLTTSPRNPGSTTTGRSTQGTCSKDQPLDQLGRHHSPKKSRRVLAEVNCGSHPDQESHLDMNLDSGLLLPMV